MTEKNKKDPTKKPDLRNRFNNDEVTDEERAQEWFKRR